jgi:APA family basic amino acid/polyamine antiporter
MVNELRRVLGLRDLTLLTVGAVIGSGIYIIPAVVLKATGGSIALATAVWFLAGVLSLLGALTYAELSAMNPEAGGLYTYLRDAFGEFPAFLYGWTLFVMAGSGSVATLAVAFSGYLRELVAVGPLAAKLVSITMIAVLCAINVRGTRQSADLQNWTTVLKAGPLFVLSLYLLFAGNGLGTTAASGTTPLPLVSGVLTAMIGVLWAYEGWQFTTFVAGEVVDPQRIFPRGLILGTALLVLLYCLASLGYVAALGVDRSIASERIAAEAVASSLGTAAGKLVAIAILVSMFSAANSIILTTPRVFFAMARDRVFFARLAEVHPRFGTPAFAVLAMGVVSMILAASGTFEQLLTYVVFTAWIFYALGAVSIFVFRRKLPNAARPFRVPAYPLTPILFVLSAVTIVVNAVIAQPVRALVGLGLVFSGAPVYLIWSTRIKRQT